MTLPRQVAITGCGAVTPLGPNAPSLWAGLSAGRRCVRPSARLANAPVNLAAEIDFTPSTNPMTWAKAALAEALHDANLPWPFPESSVALGLAPGWSWPERPGKKTPTPLHVDPGQLGLSGADLHVWTSFSACAAGLQLVEEAARRIRLGHVEVAVVVAFDSRVNQAAVEGYARLGALAQPWAPDPQASCRPFDRHRSGFVVGEGAAALILESEASVATRGARVRAWVAGAASTCDTCSPVAPELTGQAAEACIRLALKQSGLPPSAIGYINAHGTGTALNDRVEADVLARVFGPDTFQIPCGSFKSMIGHLAMACGLVELVGCLPVLAGGPIPANQNLDHPDAPLRLTGWGRDPADVSLLLKTSFGFGGMNTAVVLSRDKPET
ncbi:MAG: beta-ketoacyl-ACP synthase II [Candidatus Methylacidiphilales bacterium]